MFIIFEITKGTGQPVPFVMKNLFLNYPCQYNTGNDSRRRSRQRTSQRISGLRNLCCHKIHTHSVKTGFRAAHQNRLTPIEINLDNVDRIYRIKALKNS